MLSISLNYVLLSKNDINSQNGIAILSVQKNYWVGYANYRKCSYAFDIWYKTKFWEFSLSSTSFPNNTSKITSEKY